MEFRLSERMNHLKASEIRELLKLTEEPDIISFAGGLPAPELFPIEEMKVISHKVLNDEGKAALQYGPTEGYTPLRKIIAEQRMKAVGVNATYENILITNGSQQGLDFTGRVFLDKDDIVICESPSYLGAINAFKAYMPKFVEIPMDDNGMIIEELEKALEKHPNAKFIYTIPDFQNPTGKTLSFERRVKMLELAEKYNIPIIEDNPYGELRFEGDMIPSIKSLDKKGLVIYLGTFSKTFCPGLRLGWICADKDILNKYIIVKQGADLQSSSISQREAAAFMQVYNLDEHINKIKEVYRRRRDLMIDMIKKEFPENIKYTYPNGGLFTWVTLPEGIDAAELLKIALRDKVAFVPGGSFFPNGGHPNHFRLNFSNMPEDKIIEGIKRLGKVLKENI
ncbi:MULTISPECIES: PLP-dependent aminotransferase family protein [Caloramator]|uniref:Aspartate aminotransferase (AspB-4) n=1 Tax=Caloramator australicus RC3 TaxID=857293 RepID=I7LFN0_9CLOT|nr:MULTISPECIES: PLP-dependent aminotransferase family protein [Caloramator]MDO6355436.1 PLP-dependent aminotransferase family protein [Caloramator sp. CAR-1]CCJ32630.1 Aspartate aminotransferase (AspB-4) [Caloramator australicus RC3]